VDVFLPITRRLNRTPVRGHDATQLRPTALRSNAIPPEGQSFMGPIDVRQPLCPQHAGPRIVPDRVARPNDDVVDSVLVSPGRQIVVSQDSKFDLYPLYALEAILRARSDRDNFDNLLRSPQKTASLPNWGSLPRIEPIKDPPRRLPSYGHIQVANEFPQKETKARQPFVRELLRIDTGPAKFAKSVKIFEEFKGGPGSGSATEVTLKSGGGDICESSD
jgi:hypothetical protein